MPIRNRFKTKEEYNAWFREYRLRNLEKTRTYSREYNVKWRKENGSSNKWKQENPEKVSAQVKLQRKVRKGDIIPKPCEFCGSKEVIGHHDDYDKPLEVRWVCKIHHRQIHYTTKPK